MKKIFVVLVATASFLATGWNVQAAGLDLLSDAWSKKPQSKLVINGRELHAKVTMLPQQSHLVEWLDDSGWRSMYWVEKLENSRIVWQASATEYSRYEYTRDENLRYESVLITVTWPASRDIGVNSKFGLCDLDVDQQCYRLKDMGSKILVKAVRNEDGGIIGGTIESTYSLGNGETATKTQELRVTYPKPNVMHVEYVGHGEPWAYVDAWQEYRVENGEVVWEVCRTVGNRVCNKN